VLLTSFSSEDSPNESEELEAAATNPFLAPGF